MAITFDSYAVGTQVNSNTLSWNHTCSGSDRILFVSVMLEFTDIISSVTYNGTSMTQVGKGKPTGGRFGYLYMLVNPDSGTHSVTVTASSTTYPQGISASYTGAKQTGQPDNSTTNTTTSGTSLATTLSTVADNCWTVMSSLNYGGVCSAGTNTTYRYDTNGVGLFDSNAAITPAGSTSLNINFASGNKIFTIMASFAPVPPATSVKDIIGCGFIPFPR